MSALHSTEALPVPGNDAGCIDSLPILVLNGHSRCNCRCLMCDIWKRDQTTEISATDLERHRESLRCLGVKQVVLTGGEPLMHGDLAGLCAFFRDLNICLTLLTTGLLLSRHAQVVAEFFEDVIISLDGPEQVHDSIRRVKGGYQAISAGIAAIRNLRSGIRVTARMTIQKANHRYLNEAVLSAKALGLNGISFLAADLTSEAFNRALLWPGERQNEIALSRSEILALERDVEDMIQNCGEEIRCGYIAESPAKLQKIVTHFKAHLGMDRHTSPRCNAPWVSAVIEADGTVRPCFFHRPIGEIRQSSLQEVINGEVARNFRRDLKVAEDPICQQCVCSLYRAG